MSTRPIGRRLIAMLSVVLLSFCCGCSGPSQGGVSDPAPVDSVDADAGGAGGGAHDESQVSECEELFATLNSLDISSMDTRMIHVAETSAAEGKERCREVFRRVAKTEGRRVIADAFADIMYLRHYELKMTQYSERNDLRTVCDETSEILERMRALRVAAGTALEEAKLEEDEVGVLRQIVNSAQTQVDALEPFLARGCVDGSFVPERFTDVSDLTIDATMSEDACRSLVVAFAAFDVEMAPLNQTILLADVLAKGTEPCRKALAVPPSTKPTLETLERARLVELIERGPMLLRSSIALSTNNTEQACLAMAGFLKLTKIQIERLTAVAQGADVEVDVRVLAGAELELSTNTLRQFEATYQAACGL